MPDFGQCSDTSCAETAVRLFDCAHHCMKMVCLQHLIEHDRSFEQTKRQIETVQIELKRLYSIYSTLIDENKIRYEYEQKLNDYKKLANEVNSLLENNSNNIEQYRLIIEKLKKSINEKQKQSNESLSKISFFLKINFIFMHCFSYC
jgi:DNA anti-recombination protein RmuC